MSGLPHSTLEAHEHANKLAGSGMEEHEEMGDEPEYD